MAGIPGFEKVFDLPELDVQELVDAFADPLSAGTSLPVDAFKATMITYLDKRRLARGATPLEVNNVLGSLFRLFDTNHDGVVDPQELIAGLSVLCPGDRDAKVAAVFHLFDYDGDGFISLDEMTRYMTSVYRAMRERDPTAFTSAGVSPDEVARATARQAFRAADTDHDGRLSLDEFMAWYSASAADETTRGLSQHVAASASAHVPSSLRQDRDAARTDNLLHYDRLAELRRVLCLHAVTPDRAVDIVAVGTTPSAAASQGGTETQWTVSRSRFVRAMLQIAASVPSTQRGTISGAKRMAAANQLFDLMDADGDGAVDAVELIAGVSLVCSGTREQQIEAAFRHIDRNRDGCITQSEMFSYLRGTFRVMRGLGIFSAEEIDAKEVDSLAMQVTQKCFLEADTDRSRRIAFHEFARWSGATSGAMMTGDSQGGQASLWDGDEPLRAGQPSAPPPPPGVHLSRSLSAPVSGASDRSAHDTPPSWMNVEDVRRLTNLGSVRIQQLLEAFRSCAAETAAASEDGAISLPQYLGACSRAQGPRPASVSTKEWLRGKSALARLFQALEYGNAPKRAKLSELVSALTVLCQGSPSERAATAFALFDTDSDGFLSLQQLTEYFTAIYRALHCLSGEAPSAGGNLPARMGSALAKRCFDACNPKRAGLVSLEEFRRWYQLGHAPSDLTHPFSGAAGPSLSSSRVVPGEGAEALWRRGSVRDLQSLLGIGRRSIRDLTGILRPCADQNSGRVTVEDLSHALPLEASSHEAMSVLRRLVALQVGSDEASVPFAEFLAGLSVLVDDSEWSKSLLLFELFDEDGDGCIDEREMERYLQAVFRVLHDVVRDHRSSASPEQLAHATAEMCVRVMDLNKDGKVSFPEFESWFLEGKDFVDMYPAALPQPPPADSSTTTTAGVPPPTAAIPPPGPPSSISSSISSSIFSSSSAPGPYRSNASSGPLDDLNALFRFQEAPLRVIFDWFAQHADDRRRLSRAAFERAARGFLRSDLQQIPGGPQRATHLLERLFALFDTDTDGYLDFVEIMAGLSTLSNDDPDTRVRTAFRLFDADDDGYVSKQEMTQYLTSLFRMILASRPQLESTVASSQPDTPAHLLPEAIAAATTDQCFREADADRDNRLSLDEFQVWYRRTGFLRTWTTGTNGSEGAGRASQGNPRIISTTTMEKNKQGKNQQASDGGARRVGEPNAPPMTVLDQFRERLLVSDISPEMLVRTLLREASPDGFLSRTAFRRAIHRLQAMRSRQWAAGSDKTQELEAGRRDDETAAQTFMELFPLLDANGDGRVSVAELGAGLSLLLGSESDQRMRIGFAMMDKNGDGSVTLSEMEEFFETLFRVLFSTTEAASASEYTADKLAKATAASCMEEADRDRNGRVTFSEFVNWASGSSSTNPAFGAGAVPGVAPISELSQTVPLASSSASSGVPRVETNSPIGVASVDELRDLMGLANVPIGQVLATIASESDTTTKTLDWPAFCRVISRLQGWAERMGKAAVPPPEAASGTAERDRLDRLKKLFALFDGNQDGHIDSAELLAGFSLLCGGSDDNKISAAFRLYDLDRDGFITPDEMQRFLANVFRIVQGCSPDGCLPRTGSPMQLLQSHGHSLPGGSLGRETKPDRLAAIATHQAFRAADKDKDGRISYQEFAEWYHNQQHQQEGERDADGVTPVDPAAVGIESAREPGTPPLPASQAPMRAILDEARVLLGLSHRPPQFIVSHFMGAVDEEGRVGEAAFQSLLRQLVPWNALEAGDMQRAEWLVRSLFHFFDEENRRFVDYDALMAGMSVLCGGNAMERAHAVFDLFDADRDGHLTQLEMEEYLTSVFSLVFAMQPEKHAETGFLSPAEFAHNTAMQCFLEADLDPRGHLSRVEFARWLATEGEDEDEDEDDHDETANGVVLPNGIVPAPLSEQAGRANAAPATILHDTSLEDFRSATLLPQYAVDEVIGAFLRECEGDGKLGRESFGRALSQFLVPHGALGQHWNEETERRLFELFDANRDGRLDMREIAAGLTALCGGSPAEKVRKAFALYDADGDGFVTPYEMRRYLTSLFRVVQEAQRRARVDGNGSPSEPLGPESPLEVLGPEVIADEATRLCFAQADLNKDGKLSLDEFVSWYTGESDSRQSPTSRRMRALRPGFDGDWDEEDESSDGEGTGEEAMRDLLVDGVVEAPSWLSLGEVKRLTALHRLPMAFVLDTFARRSDGQGFLTRPAFDDAFQQLLHASTKGSFGEEDDEDGEEDYEDDNEDGAVAASSAPLLRQQLEERASPEELDARRRRVVLDRMFQIFDGDGDGRVDFVELAAGLTVLCAGSREERTRVAFTLFDSDGDGFLSRDELKLYLTCMFRVLFESSPGIRQRMEGASPEDLAAATTDQSFAAADSNRDGRISLEEFQRWYGAGSHAVEIKEGNGQVKSDEVNRDEVGSVGAYVAALRRETFLDEVQIHDVLATLADVCADDVQRGNEIEWPLFLAACDHVLRTTGLPERDPLAVEAVTEVLFDLVWSMHSLTFDRDAEDDDNDDDAAAAVGSGVPFEDAAVALGLLAGGSSASERMDELLALFASGPRQVIDQDGLSTLLSAVYRFVCSLSPSLAAGFPTDPDSFAEIMAEQCLSANKSGIGAEAGISFAACKAWFRCDFFPQLVHERQETMTQQRRKTGLQQQLGEEPRMPPVEEVQTVFQLEAFSLDEVLHTLLERATLVARSDGPLEAMTETGFVDALTLLATLGGSVFPSDRLQGVGRRLFHALDADGDGVVDFQELASGFTVFCGGDADDKIRATFVLFDRDGDGHLSQEELQQYMHAVLRSAVALQPQAAAATGLSVQELAKQTAEQAFQDADTDRDGKLSFQEFHRWVLVHGYPGGSSIPTSHV